MSKNINELRTWSRESVRQVCIANRLYTKGNAEEYDCMLSSVEMFYPSTENIAFVAENILKHSVDQTLENIMSLLVNNAVAITYEIAEEV